MNDLSRMIDQELETKKAMAQRLVTLRTNKDNQGVAILIRDFSVAFCGGDMKEAEQELDMRVKMLNPTPPPKSTRPKKEVPPEDRHNRVYDQLPEEVQTALKATINNQNSTLIRMFKKAGREYTSLVVTLNDGRKRLFRKTVDSITYVEVDRAALAAVANTKKPTKTKSSE